MSLLGRPDAVLFDLDDTLLVDVDAVARAFAVVCEPEGIDPTAFRARARELWRALPTWEAAQQLGVSSWEGLVADFSGAHPCEAPFAEVAPGYRRAAWGSDELAERFRVARSSSFELFTGTEDVLETLAANGIQLALVTNGPSDLQRAKVAATGLGRWFRVVVVSGEIGVGKPEAAGLERAFAGVGAREAVMVGDSQSRDVAAAKAAGMASVWIDRWARGGPDPDGSQPDVVIADLAELPALLGVR